MSPTEKSGHKVYIKKRLMINIIYGVNTLEKIIIALGMIFLLLSCDNKPSDTEIDAAIRNFKGPYGVAYDWQRIKINEKGSKYMSSSGLECWSVQVDLQFDLTIFRKVRACDGVSKISVCRSKDNGTGLEAFPDGHFSGCQW